MPHYVFALVCPPNIVQIDHRAGLGASAIIVRAGNDPNITVISKAQMIKTRRKRPHYIIPLDSIGTRGNTTLATPIVPKITRGYPKKVVEGNSLGEIKSAVITV